MRHKIYNLDGQQTILGIDTSDIMIGLITWMLGNFLSGEFLPPRLQTLVTVVLIGLVLTLWRTTKDKFPPGFFRHLLAWATEANIYRVGPDTKARPAVVNHQQVMGFLLGERRSREKLRARRTEPTQGSLNVRHKLRHAVKLTPPPQSQYAEPVPSDAPSPKVTVSPGA